jgi:hypothetical protein
MAADGATIPEKAATARRAGEGAGSRGETIEDRKVDVASGFAARVSIRSGSGSALR